MSMLRRVFGLLGLAAAVSLAPGAAQAVPTYTQNFTDYSCSGGVCTGSATTGAQITDYLAVFNIPVFDTTLGTLTRIVITLSGAMDAVGSVTNIGAGTAVGVLLTQNSTITTNPPQAIAGSGGLILVTSGSNGGDSNLSFTTSASAAHAVTSAGQSPGRILAGDTVSGVPLAATFATQSLVQTNNFDVNLKAVGGGTFAVTFATGEYTTTGGSGGNLQTSVTTKDTITMTVEYDYTSPEPASLTLLGAGLLGLGAVIRRRRRV